MKKLTLLALSLVFFGCESSNKSETTTTENTSAETETTTSVEEGAGSEISPQLEGIEDSAARLKVDTISSAAEAQESK